MKKILLLILFFTSINVSAGIFGASNYEECVLEKMKGQVQALLPTARNACYMAFPPEPTEQTINIENGQWEWKQNNPKEIVVEVKKVPKKTKLLRADAVFMVSSCGEKQSDSGFAASAEKSLIGDKFEFKVNNKIYKCAQVTFTGIQ